jgi:hypothetical protein
MVHSSYRAVDAVRKARYFRPESRRPVDRRQDKARYQRPPRGAPRRSR